MKDHDYILKIDEIETVFEVVGELTTTEIPHKDYRYIPLDIGIGMKEIDENKQKIS